MINHLDESRELEGLTKAGLSRPIERAPETVRRLLTAKATNPQLGLIAELAAALGDRLILERTDEERRQIAEPLRARRNVLRVVGNNRANPHGYFGGRRFRHRAQRIDAPTRSTPVHAMATSVAVERCPGRTDVAKTRAAGVILGG
ncbi:MAG: hypothetical protein JO079_05525 [Frankiaceae bacterium]|nr:hypothetical protein [Frankiaceae bacterium]